MERIYVAVWIDHASARMVELTNGQQPKFTTIQSQVEPRHRSTGQWGVPPPGHIGGNTESHDQNRREEQFHRFYDLVLEKLSNCDGLLIMGPGEAKHELIGRMKRMPQLHARVLKTETASRMSNPQMAARLRLFAATPEADD